jgi:hypothetical protein
MGTLRFASDGQPGTFRHLLDGKPVHSGQVLEIALARGVWVLGRYEWSFRRGRSPTFRLKLASGDVMVCRLPPSAELRWPSEGAEKNG